MHRHPLEQVKHVRKHLAVVIVLHDDVEAGLPVAPRGAGGEPVAQLELSLIHI